MVNSFDNILSSGARRQLFALQGTAKQLAETQLRLATGRKVNSALDNPNSFFAARNLNAGADDIFRLLDNVAQNAQVIKAASHGLEGIGNLLELLESTGTQALESSSGVSGNLSEQILAENPDAYWQLNEMSGGTAQNLGAGGAALNATYVGGPAMGQPPIYTTGSASVDLNGTNQYISVPDSNLINLTTVSTRTVELVFRADETGPRQVLYEEGAAVNDMSIYIENNSVYVNGRDQGDWGPFNINAPIVAGETYHVALVLDQPNGEMRGYLNGNLMGTGAVTIPLSAHSGNIGIGAMNEAAWFHDGSENGNGNYFNGHITDVAIHNQVLSAETLGNHADAINTIQAVNLENDAIDILRQIDEMAADSSYRGTNLLQSDTMTSVFNASRTSLMNTQGDDFSSAGLNLTNVDFSDKQSIQMFLSTVRAALNTVRKFERSFASDINVLKIRQDQMNNSINIFREGADKLTLADLNEEGAKMLSLQTRQQIQMEVLRSSNSGTSIADVLLDTTV